MVDRPIIFSAPMVRALLDGRKTQTRRLASSPLTKAQPGDRLYVREAWADPTDQVVIYRANWREDALIRGLDNVPETDAGIRWRPSIHMPRWASRLTLVVEDVRFQRLQDITDTDAFAEGLEMLDQTLRDGVVVSLERPWAANEGWGSNDEHSYSQHGWDHPRMVYADLWESLHGTKPGERWEDNPDIVALTFTVHRYNIDALGAAHG